MTHFLFILTGVILPILLQVLLGFGVQKVASLDVKTLSRAQFYYFIPSYMFYKLATAQVPGEMLVLFFSVSTLLMGVMGLTAIVISMLNRYSKPMRAAFTNSLIFYNSGNICIPLIDLLYTDPLATLSQLCVLIYQNITTNSLGVFNASSGKAGVGGALLGILKMPMVYAIAAGLAVNGFGITIPEPGRKALEIAAAGMVPLALFTLGAQLARARFDFRRMAPILAAGLRLVLGPVVAFLLVRLTGMTGIPAQVLIICAAAPTAVNTALLAVQYGNEPDFASQAVLLSTLASPFTLSLAIWLVMQYVH